MPAGAVGGIGQRREGGAGGRLVGGGFFNPKRVTGVLLKGKSGENKSVGEGYNPTFAGIFTLLRPRTGALRGLGQHAVTLFPTRMTMVCGRWDCGRVTRGHFPRKPIGCFVLLNYSVYRENSRYHFFFIGTRSRQPV